MYIIKRKKGAETYITENSEAGLKVAGGLDPFIVSNITLKDFVAHFAIQAPEEKMQLHFHPAFPEVYKVSNPPALDRYVKEAVEISQLPEFDARRNEWEQKKIENRKALEALAN